MSPLVSRTRSRMRASTKAGGAGRGFTVDAFATFTPRECRVTHAALTPTASAMSATGMRASRIAATVVERVAAHILATAAHTGSGDAALVVDLDLTILAARPPEYERFEQQIRGEYAHVPDELFRAGRRQVLQRFLARPSIYQVPTLRDALERLARRNLEHRIAQLR